MKIGIVGVGVIASAVAKALMSKYGEEAQLFLSPKNREKSAALASLYPNAVVAPSNQDVLDNADIVILAVLPQIAPEVVSGLKFRPDQDVVSLIGTPYLAELSAWIGQCKTLTRVIPAAFIENRNGPILVYPGTPLIIGLFDGLGQLVVTGSEDEFTLAHALSTVMGPFFFLCDSVVDWAAKNGLAKKSAASYLFSLIPALSELAKQKDPERLAELWQEMTPGGLNESTINTVRSRGGFELWNEALDIVYKHMK